MQRSVDYLHARAGTLPHGRPLPWYEVVPMAHTGDLALKFGAALGLPNNTSLARAVHLARQRVRWFNRFGRRTLGAAFSSVGIPLDQTVLIVPPTITDDDMDAAIRITLRDLAEFPEQLLPLIDDGYLLDESGRWFFVAHHEGELGALIFEPRVTFDGRGVKGGWA